MIHIIDFVFWYTDILLVHVTSVMCCSKPLGNECVHIVYV